MLTKLQCTRKQFQRVPGNGHGQAVGHPSDHDLPPGWARGTLGLSGASSDATSGIASVELSLNGGASWQSLGGSTNWGYSWDTTSVSDGSHTLLARAVDLAGNPGNTASLTVNVDNTPPGVVLSGPPSFCPSCTTNAPLGNASLSLLVSDASSGIGSWSLSAGATVIASGAGAASQTILWNGSGLGLGAQTLVLTATDLAGNANSVNLAIRLVAAPPDPEPTVEAFSIPLPDRNPGAIQELPQQPASTIVPARQQAIVPIVPEPAADPADSPAPVTGAPAFPDILWGTAAAAAIGAATTVALDEQRKRKQEEAQAAAETSTGTQVPVTWG